MMLIAAAAALCLAAPPRTGPVRTVVFSETFQAPTLARHWTASGSDVRVVTASGGRRCLEVTAAGAVGATARTALPVARLRGLRVVVEAAVRARDVVQPPNAWNGVKVMLHVRAGGADTWKQRDSIYGTFDWQAVRFVLRVPANAESAELVLGLENAAGTASFDDVTVTTLSPPPAGAGRAPSVEPRLRGAMIGVPIGQADLETLAGEWGANHVRWQLVWGGFPQSPADSAGIEAYDRWLNAELDRLDGMLPALQRLGVRVLIDLHTPPGGRNATSECRIFSDRGYQEHFLRVWDRIARRFRGRPAVWGYDLVNEPCEGMAPKGLMGWQELATKAARLVRSIDPVRAIVVEPAPWGSPDAMDNLLPIDVPGVVYGPHMYLPHAFTHQGVHFKPLEPIRYPGIVDGRMWDREALRDALRPTLEFQRTWNVPIYIGEFSAIRWAPDGSGARYLSDCIDLFEQYNWSWAYHAFREWDGWSVEHGSDPASHARAASPTDREQLLRRWFALNPRPAGANLMSDPGFEATGEVGGARSGARAGHLSARAETHWASVGGKVELQPFARYRLSLWSHGRTGRGSLFAPYVFAWDSYEWAFVTAGLQSFGQSWARTEVEFIAPGRDVYVYPLAAMGTVDCDAWVDDVTLTKVAEPAEAMAPVLARADKSENDWRLVVRWLLATGRADEAALALSRTAGETRADIATVLALATHDRARRRRFLVDALAWGGPSYHDGAARFLEMAAPFATAERLAMCADALRANPGLDRVGRGVCAVVEAILAEPDSAQSVTARRAAAEQMRSAVQGMLAAIPGDSPAAGALRPALARVDAVAEAAVRARAELGSCTVKIGGVAIRPTTHAIVLPDAPTPQERSAARRLQRELERVTGAALPVALEARRGRAIPLYVGRCRAVAHPELRLPVADLGLEGLRIRTAGPAIAFAGGRRGVGYAVTTFLQDYLGCRWFTADCAAWPRRGTFALSTINRRYIPPLEYRGGDYPVARPGEFASAIRLNGAQHEIPDDMGGRVGVHALAHTFAGLCPPETYFAQHPEYFSLVRGKRQSGYAQLCLTNPDVLRIVIAGVRKWIREMPGMTVFSVSQNDTGNWCECAKCAAISRAEGSESGPMLRFVNAVADDIRRDHPGVAIETLAYQYTRKPPKITRPRPNVIVCLCTIECCFIHPLASDPANRSFVADIQGWSRICKRLWIWDYIINYAHSISPFPNLRVLKPNISFFIRNGVTGIYEESCYYTKGSELQELRNYLMAQALWNPSADMSRATTEFCGAYYGAAAPFILRYLDTIHAVAKQGPKLHVMIYSHPRDSMTPEIIAASRALFDQAEAAVRADAVRLQRVQVARLPIIYAEIAVARGGAYVEQGGALRMSDATDVTELADRFAAIAKREGVTQVREGGGEAGLDAWLASLPRRSPNAPIERLSNGSLEVSVLPAMGGRIWRLRTLPEGRELLMTAGREGAWQPLEHGYEEYGESGYRAPGWSEPYSVVRRTERAVELEARLSSGLVMRRRIELDERRAVVTVTSSVTNSAAEPRNACLRVHPAFRVDSTAAAEARVMGAAGAMSVISLANPADPSAERDMWFQGTETPLGAWSILDRGAGVELVNRFDPTTVGKCLLNWAGSNGRVNLEVFSPERVLAPGASISLRLEYEVVRHAR